MVDKSVAEAIIGAVDRGFDEQVRCYRQRSSGVVDGLERRVLHGLDILWTSALTFVSEGPVSPFFLFFLFVVLAAAYRRQRW